MFQFAATHTDPESFIFMDNHAVMITLSRELNLNSAAFIISPYFSSWCTWLRLIYTVLHYGCAHMLHSKTNKKKRKTCLNKYESWSQCLTAHTSTKILSGKKKRKKTCLFYNSVVRLITSDPPVYCCRKWMKHAVFLFLKQKSCCSINTQRKWITTKEKQHNLATGQILSTASSIILFPCAPSSKFRGWTLVKQYQVAADFCWWLFIPHYVFLTSHIDSKFPNTGVFAARSAWI